MDDETGIPASSPRRASQLSAGPVQPEPTYARVSTTFGQPQVRKNAAFLVFIEHAPVACDYVGVTHGEENAKILELAVRRRL